MEQIQLQLHYISYRDPYDVAYIVNNLPSKVNNTWWNWCEISGNSPVVVITLKPCFNIERWILQAFYKSLCLPIKNYLCPYTMKYTARVVSEYDTDTMSKFIIPRVDKRFWFKRSEHYSKKLWPCPSSYFPAVITRGCLSRLVP